MRERFRSTAYAVPQNSNERFRHVLPKLESNIETLASKSKEGRKRMLDESITKLREARHIFYPAKDWILAHKPKNFQGISTGLTPEQIEDWRNDSEYADWKVIWNAGVWRANKLKELDEAGTRKKRWTTGVRRRVTGAEEIGRPLSEEEKKKELRNQWETKYGTSKRSNDIWESSGHVSDYLTSLNNIVEASSMGIGGGKILGGISIFNPAREDDVRADLRARGVSDRDIEISIKMTKTIQVRSGVPELKEGQKPGDEVPIKGGMVAEYSEFLRRIFKHTPGDTTLFITSKPEHAKK